MMLPLHHHLPNLLLQYTASHWGHHAYGPAEGACEDKLLAFLWNRPNVACTIEVLWLTGGASKVHLVAFFGLERTMRALFEDMAEADSKDRHSYSPRSYNAEEGHEAVVKMLVARDDVEVDTKDEDSRSPLFYAAAAGHEAVVKILAARDDVQVNAKDKEPFAAVLRRRKWA